MNSVKEKLDRAGVFTDRFPLIVPISEGWSVVFELDCQCCSLQPKENEENVEERELYWGECDSELWLNASIYDNEDNYIGSGYRDIYCGIVNEASGFNREYDSWGTGDWTWCDRPDKNFYNLDAIEKQVYEEGMCGDKYNLVDRLISDYIRDIVTEAIDDAIGGAPCWEMNDQRFTNTKYYYVGFKNPAEMEEFDGSRYYIEADHCDVANFLMRNREDDYGSVYWDKAK